MLDAAFDGRVVFVDRDALGATEGFQANAFQLDAGLFHDRRAAGEDGNMVRQESGRWSGAAGWPETGELLWIGHGPGNLSVLVTCQMVGIMSTRGDRMKVSIPDVPANVVASYEEAARVRGVSIDYFPREHLIEHAPPVSSPRVDAKAATVADRLRRLREKIVASGIPLLNDDELRVEIRERRGMIAETEL